VKMSITDLNTQMVVDAMSNASIGSNVMWWIDVSMKTVSRDRVDKYLKGFGLPMDSKFKNNFGQFGSRMVRAEKSHIYPGNGTSATGSVSSISFFLQSISILKLPMINNIPASVESVIDAVCSDRIATSLKDYYTSRLSFLYENAQYQRHAETENFAVMYESAQNIAEVSHSYHQYDFVTDISFIDDLQ
jgi:hypothetical protein